MSQPIDQGDHFNTIPPKDQINNSGSIQRPFKIQKVHIPPPQKIGVFTSYQHNQDSGEGTSANHQFSEQEQKLPELAENTKNNEEHLEDKETDPFFFYQDSHVQDSINHCKNSILGKILAEKPISTQILHSTLSGIWCNPQGFQLSEIEGKVLQIRMDKEEDIQRILKGSPWIIRNCWLVLHGWNRSLDIASLDFTHVPFGSNSGVSLFTANPSLWERKWEHNWGQFWM